MTGNINLPSFGTDFTELVVTTYCTNISNAGALIYYGVGTEKDAKAAALLCNRAMAYIQLKKFQLAAQDSQNAIDIDDKYIAGYVRKVQALQQLDALKVLNLF